MNRSQIKLTIDLLFCTLEGELKTLTKERKYEELAELVDYYNKLGILPALRIHWPAINEFLDKALKLRYIKDNNNGSGGVIE